jgi:transposase, IS5 family
VLGTVERQTSIFYFAFGQQASLIKDDLLEPIDKLLDDPHLVALVRGALQRRCPRSSATGRIGIAPERLLRCCALKHIKGWSLRELVREIRGSLVYRRFTRFDDKAIPDFSTFSRLFAVLGDDTTRAIHAQIVEIARVEGVVAGKQLRVDSTVVESNVHYPTDSTLLQDGIRVLQRGLKRIAQHCQPGFVRIVDHQRAAKLRVLEIHRAAKSRSDAAADSLKDGYRKLLALSRGVVSCADKVGRGLASGALPIVGDVKKVLAALSQVDHFTPLVKRVIAQAQARVFDGDTHVPNKVLSLFEDHTQVIRKGKPHKPAEFGRIVRIGEVEHGLVSDYDIKDGTPADVSDWMPALSQHLDIFGHAPSVAAGDRGYFSAHNEARSYELGVKKVALPARGRLGDARLRLQKQRWFRRAQRWRAGVESRIATLKHRFGMDRACYKGNSGFKRHVGWSVIANNLVAIARAQLRYSVGDHDEQPRYHRAAARSSQ